MASFTAPTISIFPLPSSSTTRLTSALQAVREISVAAASKIPKINLECDFVMGGDSMN